MLFTLLSIHSSAGTAQALSDEGAESIPVLIGFTGGTDRTQQMSVISALNGTVLRRMDAIRVVQVELPLNNKMGRNQITQRLVRITNTYPSVAFAELDTVVRGTDMPNDPDLDDSGKMYTPGVLGLEAAWGITTGSPDVVIAVLDTGIAKDHPEFVGKFLPGYDFHNNDADPSDDHGHGSHVGGIAAAAVNNGEGIAGICGQCTVMPVKVLNENNAGSWSGVSAGIIYAADEGAHVISLSLGSSTGSETVKVAIQHALDAGAIVVAAAGNSSSDSPFYPAAYDGVIAVAATDAQDERWSLSNYGSYIDVSAPGSSVYSTFYDLDNAYGGYAFMSGTSMAAPHVSGLIGLLLSQQPTRTPDDIESLLFNTSADLGTEGWDPYFGHGRIDPVAALTADVSDPRTAIISGFVWEDTNGNAQPDQDETERISDALIEIRRNGQETPLATVRTRSNGSWSLSQLPADTYVVSFIERDGYQVTGSSEVEVQLSTAEHENDINFGLSTADIAELVHKTYVPAIMVNRAAR